MFAPASGRRTPQGASMRTVLLVYIAIAGATAVGLVDTPWFVLHGAAALAGVCALGEAVHYAGLVGEAERELYGEEDA